MTYNIEIQNATENPMPLSEDELIGLASLALRDHRSNTELTIRLVNSEEMTHLNQTYRQQNKTTNVLAFPSSLPDAVALEYPLLGDIIICPQVILAESNKLRKTLKEHWSLILIHGVLHLLGYDHTKEEDAIIMQALEIKLLDELGYSNPYDTEDNELE